MLDLDIERHRTVCPETFEMQLRDTSKFLLWSTKNRKLSTSICDELIHRSITDRVKNIVLVFEIQVDRAIRYAGRLGDISDLGIKETFLSEHRGRRSKDRFALIRNRSSNDSRGS